MKLEHLRPPIGSRKRPKVIGRGPGSGHGKTSTRGHKGQMSRSGAGRSPGFEGGQMPLIRRLPKRGFSGSPKQGYKIINLKPLSKLKKEPLITPELLKEKGILKGRIGFLKVLGTGEIDVPLHIKAHAFSKQAMDKITAVGGKCEVIK